MRGTRGQATVEALGVLPLLVALLLAVAQAATAAWASLAAHDAARAAARAASLGGDAPAVARAALPASLRARADVVLTGDAVRVAVRPPRLVPRLALDVSAEAGR